MLPDKIRMKRDLLDGRGLVNGWGYVRHQVRA